MKILKTVFNFYLNSSIHVGFSLFAMTWVTMIEYNLPFDANVLYFMFFAAVTGYSFVKYFGLAKFHHRSLARWLRAIQIFSAIAFVLMCYYLFQLQLKALVLIFLMGIVTFLYAIPLIPKHLIIDEKQNLRQIGGLKVYVVAFVCALVTVLLPIYNFDKIVDVNVIITVLQRFVLVIALMLPFEIADLNYDSLKLATIPQKIGIKKTKIAGVLLLLVFLILEYFKDKLIGDFAISTLIITLITLFAIVFANKNRSKYYTHFWVESIPIFWLVILLLFA